jgi:hypothetical protein
MLIPAAATGRTAAVAFINRVGSSSGPGSSGKWQTWASFAIRVPMSIPGWFPAPVALNAAGVMRDHWRVGTDRGSSRRGATRM